MKAQSRCDIAFRGILVYFYLVTKLMISTIGHFSYQLGISANLLMRNSKPANNDPNSRYLMIIYFVLIEQWDL